VGVWKWSFIYIKRGPQEKVSPKLGQQKCLLIKKTYNINWRKNDTTRLLLLLFWNILPPSFPSFSLYFTICYYICYCRTRYRLVRWDVVAERNGGNARRLSMLLIYGRSRVAITATSAWTILLGWLKSDILPRLKSWTSSDSLKLRRIACSSCFCDPACSQSRGWL
jgi:hypothetical protein